MSRHGGAFLAAFALAALATGAAGEDSCCPDRDCPEFRASCPSRYACKLRSSCPSARRSECPGGLVSGATPAGGQLAPVPHSENPGTRAAALSDAERAALEKLAAENPELAEQAAGYLTNEDLITILLVILIVVIII